MKERNMNDLAANPDPLHVLEADPWAVWLSERQPTPLHLPQLPGVQFRRAAVLVALTREASPRVLLTVRSGDLPTHKGQIAFPGGSLETGETPVQAALREADEEVSLSPAAVQVLGELDDVFTPVGFHVTPVLGRIDPAELPRLRPTPEVTQIITPTLQELREVDTFDQLRILPDGTPVPLYRHPWQGFDIWGMTSRVLHDLMEQGPG